MLLDQPVRKDTFVKHNFIMKKIITNAALVLVMGTWAVFALAAKTTHEHTCHNEWKTAFDADEILTGDNEVGDTDRQELSNPSLSAEGLIPGGLQNFLQQ